LTTPSTRSAGDNDWLLILEASGDVSLSPSLATVPPRGTKTFTASGGSGGYTWSLAVNASGGAISPSGGYQAGPPGNVSAEVRVADSLGGLATAVASVTAGVSISPASATVAPNGSKSFAASGGSGAGYTFSLLVNASGGSISPTGNYAAGPTTNSTD